jgi:hypothetical protein
VVESWVDLPADIDAINRGQATRNGNRFSINGREYVSKGDGGSYPVSGPGVHQLGRGAFKALGVYNELGMTHAAERQLDLQGIRPEEREDAARAWLAERET